MGTSYNSRDRRDRSTSLSWHLAEALKAYIYSPSSHLDRRTDLIGFIAGIVASMLDWKTKDQETVRILAELDEDVAFLEMHYEPVIDELPYLVEQRAAYRAEQRHIMKKILNLIRANDLLSDSIMREVYAGKWGESRRGDFDG